MGKKRIESKNSNNCPGEPKRILFINVNLIVITMKKIKTLKVPFLVACCLVLVTFNSKAQNNALALNGAYIVMDGGKATNKIELVINQPNESGIVRLSGGGHIHSEGQYHVVKWLTNEETGSYVFPFGVGGDADNYIPFTFNKTAGNSSVTMSTWATNQQNSPKPGVTNVDAVTNMSGATDSVLYAIDRFWDIQASGTTADLTFSYLGSENTTLNPEDNVMAQRWNGTDWENQVGPGTAGVTTGVGTAGPYVDQNSFSPWVLVTSNPVGVESLDMQNTISVYPNPASDKVNVVIDEFDPTTEIILVDNLGKVIRQIKPTNNTSTIDINSLAKGFYTLIIRTEKSAVNKKIIKQ